MTTFAIVTTATEIAVTSPYNPRFAHKARHDLGGRWTGSSWVFDIRNEQAVRVLVTAEYGWNEGAELVSLRISFDAGDERCCSPIVRAGRVIASASGRDSGARLGDGVVLANGSVGSGGSMKNWLTVISEGSVIVVHDIPRKLAEAYVGRTRGYEGERYEIVECAPAKVDAHDKEALRSERMRLATRLAEIDAILERAP